MVRVKKNQTGVQNKTFKMYQVVEGLKDPQTWGYGVIALTTTLPTSGLGAFANIIISSFGFSVLETQLLAMVLGFYILIVLLSSAWLVKKTNQNLLVMLAYCIPSFIGTALLMTIEPSNFPRKVGLLICYYITLSFWSAQTLNLSLVSRNIAGQTKKTVVVASNFIIWAAGNAIGKYTNAGHLEQSVTKGLQGPKSSSAGMLLAISLLSPPIWAATSPSSVPSFSFASTSSARTRRRMKWPPMVLLRPMLTMSPELSRISLTRRT